ncbi:exported protein of unknown function [Micropruina glycogenica]|uniref:Uncharacterized protein n=1 Tax=Micropruina glycogenica TaxID=75385 RepID=A0A2N9JD26_9ACTN|nr:exported protein of unknown function [Micropruina glycogenica]
MNVVVPVSLTAVPSRTPSGFSTMSKQSLPMNQTKLTDKVAARRSCVPTSFRRTPESHDVAARADSCAAT